MRGLIALAGLLLAVAGVARAYNRTVRYDGDRVFRCDSSKIGKAMLQKIVQHEGADMWAQKADGTFDIRTITAQNGDQLAAILIKSHACHMIISSVEDYMAHIEAEVQGTKKADADWFEEYHTYDEIVAWYRDLANEYSSLMRYVPFIGISGEARFMPAVHISSGSSGNSSRHRIYFQCQIHAREWISGATCMYVVNHLVTSYSTDERVKSLLDSVEFVVVPLVNPDGYVFTFDGDRLWRKNRRLIRSSACRGVDLNRNYNSHWNEGGSSSNPCSETYHGASAASEPETQNTQNYFKENFPVVGAIDWHSYSQLILRPWGYTTQDSPDEARLRQLGDSMRDLIHAVHGMNYTSQKSVDLYPTSGTASDWFYDTDANTGNSARAAGYTIELRDTGRYGFLLPPSEIIPTGEEMVPAVMEFGESLDRQPLYPIR